MDFQELLKTVGLWPALVIMLAYWIDRIRREQLASLSATIDDKDAEIKELRDEARQTVDAKNEELKELRRIALETRPRR